MKHLASLCERIASTAKKLEKTALVADYLKSRTIDEAATAAIFLSSKPFPAWDETTLNVGGALLWRIVSELSERSETELTSAYRQHGDLGAVASAVLPAGSLERDLSVVEIQRILRQIAAAHGPAMKGPMVRDLLSQVTPLEAKYIIKIMTGDLRIGLKESLVEAAIAKAFGGTLAAVQRANMMLGDPGQTLQLASAGKLAEASMRMFHPVGFMLASPAESAEEALSYFQNALVEDKYDGIRAQVHCSAGEVRIFSRTRDDITSSFPELPSVLAGLPENVILDGEIVAWSYLSAAPSEPGRALPFSALQQRLGRKKVSPETIRKVPVAYLVFDILYAGDQLLIERPLRERGKILDDLLAAPRLQVTTRSAERQGLLGLDPQESPAPAQLIRASTSSASSPEELNRLFDAAQSRGNEGLMLKNPNSPYIAGRRGKSWLKMKRELATLDVVVTAVEYGHGKRIGVLSDYTFAVWDGDRLVNIGKAYSGLTDIEIGEMTKWCLEHTLEVQGMRLVVEPKIVLEVAFNNMMRSDRHDSGYALRFPRIVRLRPDKLPQEADTIERAQEIYGKQGKSDNL
jgi:DNA ligase 1